jgi:hypothetical protein
VVATSPNIGLAIFTILGSFKPKIVQTTLTVPSPDESKGQHWNRTRDHRWSTEPPDRWTRAHGRPSSSVTSATFDNLSPRLIQPVRFSMGTARILEFQLAHLEDQSQTPKSREGGTTIFGCGVPNQVICIRCPTGRTNIDHELPNQVRESQFSPKPVGKCPTPVDVGEHHRASPSLPSAVSCRSITTMNQRNTKTELFQLSRGPGGGLNAPGRVPAGRPPTVD